MKIKSVDKCQFCGHFGFDGSQKPARIYSAARAKWLEEAANAYLQIQGDDDWLDWMEEGRRLILAGE